MFALKFVSVCSLVLGTEFVFSSPELTTLESAAKKGWIQLQIKSKGGFTGAVIDLVVTNLLDNTLSLKLPAGQRLDSQQQNEQDILVTESQEFFVSAKKKKLIHVNGMCCQAHNSAPHTGAVYSIGHPATSELISLANFIDTNNYEKEYAAQEAVWTISDGNSLGSIGNGDSTVVKKLQQFVSNLTGRPIPDYRVRYGNGNGSDLVGKPTSVQGIFEYELPANGHVKVGIYDSSGKLVQLLVDDLCDGKGSGRLFYTFRTKDLPSGKYYTRMMLDGMLTKESPIEF